MAWTNVVTTYANFKIPTLPYRVVIGKMDITEYATSGSATITTLNGTAGTYYTYRWFRASGASGLAKGILGCWFSVTDIFYFLRMDINTGIVTCYQGDYSNSSDGPLVEGPNGTDVGAAWFMMVGLT